MQKLRDFLTRGNTALYGLAGVAILLAIAVMFFFNQRGAITDLPATEAPQATDSTSPDVAYLSLKPGSESGDVWRVDLNGQNAKQITSTGGMVKDFSVSNDGQKLAYSTGNNQGGDDLWIIDRNGANAQKIVDCGPDTCTSQAWSPDGKKIAYSRTIEQNDPQNLAGLARVWLWTAGTAQNVPLFEDASIQGIDPVWSPDGRKIAVFDSNARGIRIVALKSGDEQLIPDGMGQVGCWSPDGTELLFTGMSASGNLGSTMIDRIDLAQNKVSPLLPQDNLVDYASPLWSPDGAWIAFSEQNSDGSGGKQIAIVKPDGNGRRPVTTDLSYNNAYYDWDAASQELVFQHYLLGQTFKGPEIVVWLLGTGETRILVENGALPQWLP